MMFSVFSPKKAGIPYLFAMVNKIILAINDKSIYVLVLLIGLGSYCYANSPVEMVSQKLNKAEITQGEFRQSKQMKFLRQPLVSTGTFTYHRSKGVIWTTLTPISSKLLINETRLLSAEGEQNLPAAFGKVFTALLGGELDKLSAYFVVTGKPGEKSWQLRLTPKDATLTKLIGAIQLNGDSDIHALELQETSGNVTRIEFSQISHPTLLTPAQQSDFELLSP